MFKTIELHKSDKAMQGISRKNCKTEQSEQNGYTYLSDFIRKLLFILKSLKKNKQTKNIGPYGFLTLPDTEYHQGK